MFQAIKNLISRRHGLRLALPLIASVLVHWGTVRAQTTACTTDAVDKEKVADTTRQMYVAATNSSRCCDRLLRLRWRPPIYRRCPDGLGPISTQGRQTLCLDGERTRVHLSCNDAWITYVNRGSVQDGSGTKDLTWLESAFLHKEAGAWKIRFFHSTRVP